MKLSTTIGIYLLTSVLLSCAVTNTPTTIATEKTTPANELATEVEVVKKNEPIEKDGNIDNALPEAIKWKKDEAFAQLNLTGISKPMLFTDNNEVLYMIYIQKPARKISIFKQTANTWKAVSSTGLPTEAVYSIGLSFDRNNTPYLFYDSERGNILKFNSGQWEKVGGSFSKGEALGIRLSFDSTNTPWVAYGDSENNIKSTVKKYSQGKWINMGSGLPQTAEPIYLSHGLDAPLLMTKKANFGNDPIHTYQLLNNKWVLKSNGENVISSVYTDVIALNKNEIYLAYSDKQSGYKLTVKKFENDTWSLVGNAGLSEGGCRSISIVKDESNSPIVMYFDNAVNATVSKKWDGSTWEIQKPNSQYTGDMVSQSAVLTSKAKYMLFSSSGKAELFFLER